jgi:hypothetical protein
MVAARLPPAARARVVYDRAMLEHVDRLPSALRANARWMRLGPSSIPALLVHPDWESGRLAPLAIWMHGRTANKELDPGRYLRWMRSGIGACTIDLPGHGERYDPGLQQAERTLDIIRQLVVEIDEIFEAVEHMGMFDVRRLAIGGMSAGGMATMVRLCRPHSFVCACVEAASGSWQHQRIRGRAMFRNLSPSQVDELNPMKRLEEWREVPFQSINSKLDEWVSFEGQAEFIAALQARYRDPARIDFVGYEQTGAPAEHIGFGRMAADAKDRQRAFLSRWLTPST